MTDPDRSRLTADVETLQDPRDPNEWPHLKAKRHAAKLRILTAAPALLAEAAEKDAEIERLLALIDAEDVQHAAAEVRASTAEQERADALASLELHRAENARLTAELADQLGDLVCISCEGPTKNVDLYCDACHMGDLEEEADRLRVCASTAEAARDQIESGYQMMKRLHAAEQTRADAATSALVDATEAHVSDELTPPHCRRCDGTWPCCAAEAREAALAAAALVVGDET